MPFLQLLGTSSSIWTELILLEQLLALIATARLAHTFPQCQNF